MRFGGGVVAAWRCASRRCCVAVCVLVLVGSARVGVAAPERGADDHERSVVWEVARAYVGVNRAAEVRVGVVADVLGGRDAEGASVDLVLLDAGSTVDGSGRGVAGEEMARSRVRLSPGGGAHAAETGASAARFSGGLDLTRRFPVIWTRRETGVLYLQCEVDGVRVGAPLVVEPMARAGRARNGLMDRLERAMRRFGGDEGEGSEAFVRALLALPAGVREELRGSVVYEEVSDAPLSGVRLSVRRDVVMETSLGRMVFRLRSDEAGETCWRFAELVNGGWYDGTVIHRVVAEDAAGRPFVVQGGDPTGTGFGGVGFRVGFEASGLEHTFGVLSLARAADDPDSGGSQFVVCLSRAGCAALDGVQVAFGELVEGGDVLRAIAGVPVGARDLRDGTGPLDRPLEPVLIERASLRASGPAGSRSRVEPREFGGVEEPGDAGR